MTEFKYPDRAKQLIRFERMHVFVDNHKLIAPTDIDGMFEIDDKIRIMYEIKHNDKPLPDGQRILFERLTDDFARLGKHSLAIVAEHYVDDSKQDVYLDDCIVRMYYSGISRKWFKPKHLSITVRQLTDRFLQNVGYQPEWEYNDYERKGTA